MASIVEDEIIWKNSHGQLERVPLSVFEQAKDDVMMDRDLRGFSEVSNNVGRKAQRRVLTEAIHK